MKEQLMQLSRQWSLQALFSPRSSHLKQLSSQRVLSEAATTGNSSKAATALATSAVQPLPASSRSMRNAMRQVPRSRSALVLALALTGFLGRDLTTGFVLSKSKVRFDRLIRGSVLNFKGEQPNET